MNVTVHKCKDSALKVEIERATLFYGSLLLSPQMRPYVDVDVYMKSNIKDLGSCCISEYNDWNKPRVFEIELRRYRTVKNTLLTLAHEMVHLKQFAKGELNEDHTKWLKQTFNSDIVNYHDLPWEIEAFSKEYILYDLYEQSKREQST